MDNKMGEAVLIGLRKFYGDPDLEWGDFETDGIDRSKLMRAALLASLPVLLGEPVAWFCTEDAEGRKFPPMTATNPAYVAQHKCNWRALYAPGMGEGDGR